MGDHTPIEWTDATWNPVTGCTKVSQGCKNCYAERVFPRAYGTRRKFTDVRQHPERLDQPLRWRRPRRVFVNSMSDLFHEDVPDVFIDQVFEVMALADRHTFQILTKRPERMRRYVLNAEMEIRDMVKYEPIAERLQWPLPNVWPGVSVEDQHTADERIPELLLTPGAIHVVSYEPALGPVQFTGICSSPACFNALLPGRYPRIDQIIAGGESGPHARPAHPDWFRSARDQCAAAGVAFFFKQWGEWSPYAVGKRLPVARVGEGLNEYQLLRVGKKRAGRLLDGREHSEYPA